MTRTLSAEVPRGSPSARPCRVPCVASRQEPCTGGRRRCGLMNPQVGWLLGRTGRPWSAAGHLGDCSTWMLLWRAGRCRRHRRAEDFFLLLHFITKHAAEGRFVVWWWPCTVVPAEERFGLCRYRKAAAPLDDSISDGGRPSIFEKRSTLPIFCSFISDAAVDNARY